MKYWWLLTLSVGLLACNNKPASQQNSTHSKVEENKYTVRHPHNLNQAIRALDSLLSMGKKLSFKNQQEEEAVDNWHFSVCLTIRNQWIRNEQDTMLRHYFRQNGIFHPDDMSSIIITSYHRKLNNKPIDLKSQIAYYRKYWAQINNCENKAERIAAAIYNQYKIGDTITLLMPVEGEGNEKSAVVYGCPTSFWNYKAAKDLKITAIIAGKYHINSESNTFFKLRILSMNFTQIQALGKSVKINVEVDVSLRDFNSIKLIPQAARQSRSKG